MLSKNLGKIGLGLGITSILVIGLLAGCGGTTTVTTTVGGSGSTATVTTTVGGGTGAAMPNIVIYGDMVRNVGCLNSSIAHRGELVIFRSRLLDPKTGAFMTADDVTEGSVQVLLPDGQKFTAKYGGHGGTPPTDSFWAVAWEVPLNYPTGSLGYEVVATAKDGRTGSFKPFQMASSNLQVAEFDVEFVRNFTVNIKADGFSTATVTCSQGAKVSFRNQDTIPHKVQGDGWDSGNIEATKTFAKAFDTAGTFVVTDAANPAFSVTIIVNAVS